MKTRPIRTVEDIRRTITEIFSGKNVKVYLFGSRARGTTPPGVIWISVFFPMKISGLNFRCFAKPWRSLMFLFGWTWWISPVWALNSGST